MWLSALNLVYQMYLCRTIVSLFSVRCPPLSAVAVSFLGVVKGLHYYVPFRAATWIASLTVGL